MTKQKKDSWFQPHILSAGNINKVVTQEAGVYVLGNMGPDQKVKVQAIKSSSNVKEQLKKALGEYQIFMYKPFKFQMPDFQQTLKFS